MNSCMFVVCYQFFSFLSHIVEHFMSVAPPCSLSHTERERERERETDRHTHLGSGGVDSEGSGRDLRLSWV